MAYHLTEAQQSLMDAKINSFSTCWKIERTDGVVLRLTDHDQVLEFESEEYSPMGSFNASARQKLSGFSEDNLEISGYLSSDAITHEDLVAGRYFEAKITELMVNNKHPWVGVYVKNVYWIAETSFSEDAWEGRIEGLARKLKPKIGDIYTHECRHELGDPICRIDVEALKEIGAIFLVDADITLSKSKFTVNGLTKGSGYFSAGRLLWTTGANAGLFFDVKDYILGAPQSTVELQLPTPFVIEPLDQFTIEPGCVKLRSVCTSKFNNLINFGGFPFIPGRDKTMQIPPESSA